MTNDHHGSIVHNTVSLPHFQMIAGEFRYYGRTKLRFEKSDTFWSLNRVVYTAMQLPWNSELGVPVHVKGHLRRRDCANSCWRNSPHSRNWIYNKYIFCASFRSDSEPWHSLACWLDNNWLHGDGTWKLSTVRQSSKLACHFLRLVVEFFVILPFLQKKYSCRILEAKFLATHIEWILNGPWQVWQKGVATVKYHKSRNGVALHLWRHIFCPLVKRLALTPLRSLHCKDLGI